MRVNLARVIWTALTGAILILVSMLGAWGASVNSRLSASEERQNMIEQSYVAIHTDMSAMRLDLHDMQQDMRQMREKGR